MNLKDPKTISILFIITAVIWVIAAVVMFAKGSWGGWAAVICVAIDGYAAYSYWKLAKGK